MPIAYVIPEAELLTQQTMKACSYHAGLVPWGSNTSTSLTYEVSLYEPNSSYSLRVSYAGLGVAFNLITVQPCLDPPKYQNDTMAKFACCFEKNISVQ